METMEERIHPQSNGRSSSKRERGSYTLSRRSCSCRWRRKDPWRVEERESVRLIQGKDCVVIDVILLLKGHTFKRPLQLVCPLEIRGVDYSVHLQEGRRDEVQPRNQKVRRPAAQQAAERIAVQIRAEEED